MKKRRRRREREKYEPNRRRKFRSCLASKKETCSTGKCTHSWYLQKSLSLSLIAFLGPRSFLTSFYKQNVMSQSTTHALWPSYSLRTNCLVVCGNGDDTSSPREPLLCHRSPTAGLPASQGFELNWTQV